MEKSEHIWIACGGTGGHFLPGLVCGKALESHNHKVSYWGEGKAIEEHLCNDHQLKLNRPKTGGGRIKRGLSLFFKQFKKLTKNKPKLCILCGGFSSFITGIFSILFRIPFVILEQNAVPGKINRLLSRFAKVAFITFPNSEKYMHSPCILSGNPVRTSPQISQKEIDILIIGGSQGAQALNTGLAKIIQGSYNITHICGPGKLKLTKEAWEKTSHKVDILEQHPQIPELAAKSRWTITRAGATSLSELAAVGCAAIAIPYPIASDNHQLLNAQYLESLNALIVLEETQFTNKSKMINNMISDPKAHTKYAKALKNSKIADINGVSIVKAVLKSYL